MVTTDGVIWPSAREQDGVGSAMCGDSTAITLFRLDPAVKIITDL